MPPMSHLYSSTFTLKFPLLSTLRAGVIKKNRYGSWSQTEDRIATVRGATGVGAGVDGVGGSLVGATKII